jgi:hypothetical protein
MSVSNLSQMVSVGLLCKYSYMLHFDDRWCPSTRRLSRVPEDQKQKTSDLPLLLRPPKVS